MYIFAGTGDFGRKTRVLIFKELKKHLLKKKKQTKNHHTTHTKEDGVTSDGSISFKKKKINISLTYFKFLNKTPNPST